MAIGQGTPRVDPRTRPELNPVAMCFAENLYRCRRQTGISQEDLGFRASLHRTEVSLLERAMRLPRIDTVVKLAGGLGVEPAVLLEGIAWNTGEITPGAFTLGGEDG
jgi:transcriptional regulator with XRE-family HTH domain